MNYEEIQCKIEELQEELAKARTEEEREYNRMILKELIDIRLLVQYIIGEKED